MKSQLSIHTEEAYFKYVEILKSLTKFRGSFEYFIAWPSVLVFSNQNIGHRDEWCIKNEFKSSKDKIICNFSACSTKAALCETSWQGF